MTPGTLLQKIKENNEMLKMASLSDENIADTTLFSIAKYMNGTYQDKKKCWRQHRQFLFLISLDISSYLFPETAVLYTH